MGRTFGRRPCSDDTASWQYVALVNDSVGGYLSSFGERIETGWEGCRRGGMLTEKPGGAQVSRTTSNCVSTGTCSTMEDLTV